jgi:pyruvate/2-oxoglutarate dehydrogenase complex dihydrolipoamide dehydrogenase (E3) component
LVEDGKRVALIEMDRAGGTCLNHGCKPTKALRASASVAHQARRAAAYVNTSEVTVDFAAAMSRVRSIIDGLRDSLDDWLAGVDGLDLLHGTATVVTDVAANSIRWPSTASI